MIFIVYVDNKTPPHIHSWLYKMEGIKNLKEQSLINISFIIIYKAYLTASYHRILLCKKKNEKKDSFSLLETGVHVWFET